ncbi:serine/threonine dehydratase [Streptomyces mirabilis]
MTNDDVREAADRIGPYIRITPVFTTEIDGRPVTLKLENLQATGSFKFRGALNGVIAGNARDDVVAASGGNHGLGVATAAKIMGLAATVYVPQTTPEAKVRRIAAQGARVVRHGECYADAEDAAIAWANQSGGSYLHAYDDPTVIAGQGTVGLEIAEHAPWCDSVAAAVGGGGLAAGLGVSLGPDRTVVAVEPEHCNGLHAAFSAGMPVDAPVDSVAASALGVSRIGAKTFALLSSGRVQLALVTEQEIARARDLLWEEFRLAVEPAAAVPFAAWLAGRVPGRHPCLVLCGANTDWHPA